VGGAFPPSELPRATPRISYLFGWQHDSLFLTSHPLTSLAVRYRSPGIPSQPLRILPPSPFPRAPAEMVSSRASRSTAAGSTADNAYDLTDTSPIDAASNGASSTSAAADATSNGASRRYLPNPASKGKGLKAILKGTAAPALQDSQPAASRPKRKVQGSEDGQPVEETGSHSDAEEGLERSSREPGSKRPRRNVQSGGPLVERDSDDEPLRPRPSKAKGKQRAVVQESDSESEPRKQFWKTARHYLPQIASDSEDDIPLLPLLRKARAAHADSEDDAPVRRTGTGRRSFPRVQVKSSCEDSCEDSIDSDAPLLPRSKGKGKAKAEHYPALSGAEDESLDQFLADDPDADDEEDEEDEYFPGPDVVDVEEAASSYIQPRHQGVVRHNERFQQILRKALEELITWAKKQPWKAWEVLPPRDRAVTIGARRVLFRTSADFLLDMFMAAFPIEVQDFIASETWTLEAILALSDTFGDYRQGVYGNFPTNGPGRSEIGCEAYVGSASSMHNRNYSDSTSHNEVASSYTVDTLPSQYQRSLHYRDICRDDVECNFRALAGFNEPVERGYVFLLEGVVMILMGTYNDRGRYHRWASKASYDLVKQVRSSLVSTLGLPEAPWKGLNAAWPFFQGFGGSIRGKPSPCANEACGAMSYPWSKRPEGYPKRARSLLNPLDPFGKYICPACSLYRERNGQLPSLEWCQKAAERVRFRQENGNDVPCDCCAILESQLPEKEQVLKDGSVTFYRTSHYPHPNFPGKRFCTGCRSFIEINQRVQTPDEIVKLRAYRELENIRRQGTAPVCDNCFAVQGGLGSKGEHHSKDGMILCMPCYSYYTKGNGMRDPELQRRLEARAQAKLDAGRP
jgi:hypothetical protein